MNILGSMNNLEFISLGGGSNDLIYVPLMLRSKEIR